MKFAFPHTALHITNELISRGGDCASAIAHTAEKLGFLAKEELLDKNQFNCGSELAMAKIVDQTTYDEIMSEIARRETEGSLQPCQLSPEQKVTSCFPKCPLIMDLLLQADKRNSPTSD